MKEAGTLVWSLVSESSYTKKQTCSMKVTGGQKSCNSLGDLQEFKKGQRQRVRSNRKRGISPLC